MPGPGLPERSNDLLWQMILPNEEQNKGKSAYLLSSLLSLTVMPLSLRSLFRILQYGKKYVS